MKVIFILTKSITFNSFLKSQADYFIKKGIKVEIACSDIKNLNFKYNFKHKIDFPNNIKDLFNLFKYFNVFSQIRVLVKKNPSAIYYLHTPVASHLFRIFNLFNKLKIVYFVHGFRFTSFTKTFRAFFFKIIEKILAFKTKIFITINNEDYNYAKQNLSRNSLFFKINGVGLDLKSNSSKKKINKNKGIKKILVIAAYKKDKGYLEILKVAEILKNKKIKIVCYGYGSYYKYNLIKIQKKIKNISFNKFDKNLKNKIKYFDILLHLSKREGLPVAVMECLSEGLPVICYNIRGNNDLVTDKLNGYFINSYKEVPGKIIYLNLEKEIYKKMRINAYNSINRNFFKKEINLNIHKIIMNFSNKQR